MPHIYAKEINVNYLEYSCAPSPTLFLHGNLASSRWWTPLAEAYQQSSKNKEGSPFVALDWRGCGQTEYPVEKGLTLDLLANDVLSALEHWPSIKQWNIVGHSTGGLIALVAMAKAPELFRKGLLLAPVGMHGVKFDDSMTEAFKQMASDKALTAAVIGSTIYGNNPDTEFFKSVVVEDAFKAVGQVGIHVLKMLADIDLQNLARSVNVPTTVCHGEFDKLLPISDSLEMAKTIPSGQFVELKGMGHCANIEAPDAFRHCLDDYLYA